MDKLHTAGASAMVPISPMSAGRFAPVAFGGSSRLTFRRLRSPTRLPGLTSQSTLGRYLDRLTWMFSGR